MNAFIDQCRTELLRLCPDLEGMVNGLVLRNPDYYEVLRCPAEVVIGFCKTEEQLKDALLGYLRFCDTFYQKQLDFVRSGAYASQEYGEVNRQVYQNAEYMAHTYYPALLFSYFFSSNYFEILRCFLHDFVPICRDKQGFSCEIGPGHGLLSGLLLRSNPLLNAIGIDISPASRQVIDRVTAMLQVRRIEVLIADATKDIPCKNNQVMICAEVLEHLPDPVLLLRQIHSALGEDGVCFLTASINMESVDHLYLFKSDAEVVAMVEACGFLILKRNIGFLTSKDWRSKPGLAERMMRKRNPCTSILILKRK